MHVRVRVCMCNILFVCASTGYVGSAKGAKQMLWERGLWRPGLTLACCKKILKELPDFKLETSELSNLWRGRSQGFELGVKCHPEMAGCGIEYCWGKVCSCCFCCRFAFAYIVCVCVQGKYEFRNFVNTKTTRREVQIKNVLTALGDKEYTVRYSDKTRPAPLPLFRVRRHVKVCARACMSRSLCVSVKVKACVCVCVCVCVYPPLSYTHVGLTGSVAIMKERIFVTRLHVLYTVLQQVAVVRDTKSSKT